jgi:hypothetical protein
MFSYRSNVMALVKLLSDRCSGCTVFISLSLVWHCRFAEWKSGWGVYIIDQETPLRRSHVRMRTAGIESCRTSESEFIAASHDLKNRRRSLNPRTLSSVQYYCINRQSSPSMSLLRTIFWTLLPWSSLVYPCEVCHGCPFQVPCMIILQAIRSW